MKKEFEIQGCVEVPSTVTDVDFYNAFIEFLDSKKSLRTKWNGCGTKKLK